MGYTPVTPFRRMIDAAQLQHQAMAAAPLPAQAVAKWDVLRELSVARADFNLTDRDLAVLQVLLSFYPAVTLDQPQKMVVFPSNQSICERLNGMPCSTMRRHLGNLVEAGVILRRDSPNGKRYQRKFGGVAQAFGFDLSPLPRLFPRILAAADRIRAEAAEIASLRLSISLMRRDLRGLVELMQMDGQDAPQGLLEDDLELAKILRRKLDLPALQRIAARLEEVLSRLRGTLVEAVQIPAETVETSTTGVENEQHYQSQKKEINESESCIENRDTERTEPQAVPLPMVIGACPEILNYALDPVRNWTDFMRLAEQVRPMLGICGSAWEHAKSAMGAQNAATTLAAILQRLNDIRSPGSYLRSLAKKAVAGEFSTMPMIRALAN